MGGKVETEVVDGDDAEGREDVDGVDHVAVVGERRRQLQLVCGKINDLYSGGCERSNLSLTLYALSPSRTKNAGDSTHMLLAAEAFRMKETS